jgi:tRNA (Thr-GGU) A37 N-methylase
VRLQLTCFDNPEHSVEGLAAYSHVWLIFWFHQNGNKSIRPKVLTLSAHRTIVRSPRAVASAARHRAHACLEGATGTVRPQVQPPRLDGAKIGVFATRSPHRPNPVGLTLARLESVDGSVVHVSGALPCVALRCLALPCVSLRRFA